MNKRVYGVLGISSIMANWNADFSGFPKSTSDGTVFGSDKALKYPMKKMWENEGEKVLYIKSMKITDPGKDGSCSLVPRSLRERYELLTDDHDLKDVKVVLKNLMDCIDVKNFGATFAETGSNISITGAVQIGQGFNKYEDTCAEEQQILSPFRDSKSKKNDEDAKNSTLGTKIVSNEAHYFYPFVINPLAYQELEGLGVTTGYTEEDYANFKNAALVSATSFATNAKVGCDNEFAIFVETKIDTYLPNLAEYVHFEKGDHKNVIILDFADLFDQLEDGIDKIDVYFDPHTTKLNGLTDQMSVYDIRTQKEV